MPAALNDRAADCWRPLLALADRAGNQWPTSAREAARALSGATEDADQPVAVLALHDVRSVFDAKAVQELSSNDLAAALRTMDSRPWATWGKDSKGLTTHALARLLKDFRIHPFKIRFGAETLNGYPRHAFEDAWTRYPLSEVEQQNNPNEYGAESRISEVEHSKSCSGSENASVPNEDGRCSGVPLQTGEIAQNGLDRRSKPAPMEVNGALVF